MRSEHLYASDRQYQKCWESLQFTSHHSSALTSAQTWTTANNYDSSLHRCEQTRAVEEATSRVIHLHCLLFANGGLRQRKEAGPRPARPISDNTRSVPSSQQSTKLDHVSSTFLSFHKHKDFTIDYTSLSRSG